MYTICRRRTMLIATTIAFAVFMVPAADALEITYDLHDHPNLPNSPPSYGLRLDDPVTSRIQTFHFVDVTGVLDTTAGTFTLEGLIRHNQGVAGMNDYHIEADMTFFNTGDINVNQLLNPDTNFKQLNGHTNLLTLTPLNGGTFGPLLWDGFMNPSFAIDTNHWGGGPEILSGFGWLRPFGDDSGHQTYQDWSFVLENQGIIPEPATMSLLGLGLVGAVVRRFYKHA